MSNILEALEVLEDIARSVRKKGYNCTCAYSGDCISMDKDWLEYRLAQLKRKLLLEIQ